MILSLLRYSHQLPTEIRYANRQKIEEIQLISLVSDLIVMYLHLIDFTLCDKSGKQQRGKSESLIIYNYMIETCAVVSMMGFMCYYGHVQNTSNLGEGNVYKSYFLGALVELPCWSVPVIISKLGRR